MHASISTLVSVPESPLACLSIEVCRVGYLLPIWNNSPICQLKLRFEHAAFKKYQSTMSSRRIDGQTLHTGMDVFKDPYSISSDRISSHCDTLRLCLAAYAGFVPSQVSILRHQSNTTAKETRAVGGQWSRRLVTFLPRYICQAKGQLAYIVHIQCASGISSRIR